MAGTLFTSNKVIPAELPLLRIIGPILSFTTGAAGGIFAPSLSAGASIGAVVAGWCHLPATSANLIILCGMTGFLTGITRSPFTCSILVIEMTDTHNIIFYIMLTALVANLVSNFISKHSFYDYLKDQYIKEIHSSELQIVNPVNQHKHEEDPGKFSTDEREGGIS
jgi:H+/Cl- antiporter ClcA